MAEKMVKTNGDIAHLEDQKSEEASLAPRRNLDFDTNSKFLAALARVTQSDMASTSETTEEEESVTEEEEEEVSIEEEQEECDEEAADHNSTEPSSVPSTSTSSSDYGRVTLSDTTGHSPISARLRLRIQHDEMLERRKRQKQLHPLKSPLRSAMERRVKRSMRHSDSSRSSCSSRPTSSLPTSASQSNPSSMPSPEESHGTFDEEEPFVSVSAPVPHRVGVAATKPKTGRKSTNEELEEKSLGREITPLSIPDDAAPAAAETKTVAATGTKTMARRPSTSVGKKILPVKKEITRATNDGAREGEVESRPKTAPNTSTSKKLTPIGDGIGENTTRPRTANNSLHKTTTDQTAPKSAPAVNTERKSIGSPPGTKRPPTASPGAKKSVAAAGTGPVSGVSAGMSEHSSVNKAKTSSTTVPPQSAYRSKKPTIGDPTCPQTQYLIPELLSDEERRRTVTIVFDLDETLVNNRRRDRTIVRPHALEVLKKLRLDNPHPVYKKDKMSAGTRLYQTAFKALAPSQRRASLNVEAPSDLELRVELILWTASVESVGRPVVSKLDPTGTIFDQTIYRDFRWYQDVNYTKDLRRLARDMDRIVIVENSPLSVHLNRKNAILVSDFVSAPRDKELILVVNILKDWMGIVRKSLGLAEGSAMDVSVVSSPSVSLSSTMVSRAPGEADPSSRRGSFGRSSMGSTVSSLSSSSMNMGSPDTSTTQRTQNSTLSTSSPSDSRDSVSRSTGGSRQLGSRTPNSGAVRKVTRQDQPTSTAGNDTEPSSPHAVPPPPSPDDIRAFLPTHRYMAGNTNYVRGAHIPREERGELEKERIIEKYIKKNKENHSKEGSGVEDDNAPKRQPVWKRLYAIAEKEIAAMENQKLNAKKLNPPAPPQRIPDSAKLRKRAMRSRVKPRKSLGDSSTSTDDDDSSESDGEDRKTKTRKRKTAPLTGRKKVSKEQQ